MHHNIRTLSSKDSCSQKSRDAEYIERADREFAANIDEWTQKGDADFDCLRKIVFRRQNAATRNNHWLGLPEGSIHYVRQAGDHTFTVCPAIREKSAFTRSQLHKHYPGCNSPITLEKIENSRRMFEGFSQKDKLDFMGKVKQVEAELLSASFQRLEWGLRYDSIERMFFPKYLPSHSDAMRAFRLPKPFLYVPETFQTLENIARLPLDRADRSGALTVSFDEWLSLFQNYFASPHPLHYFLQVTGSTTLFTREFVNHLAEYLAERCECLGNGTTPILDVGSPTGRLAFLLNETKKLPASVLSCCDTPLANPYLLKIPRHMQSAFDLPAPQGLDIDPALQKYRPKIVLCQDMPMNKDLTAQMRAEGSVLEYLLIGVPYSYLSGHPWLTWGLDSNQPGKRLRVRSHHAASGFKDRALNHLSRWLICRHDSHIATGFSQVISFTKQGARHSATDRGRYAMLRFLRR